MLLSWLVHCHSAVGELQILGHKHELLPTGREYPDSQAGEMIVSIHHPVRMDSCLCASIIGVLCSSFASGLLLLFVFLNHNAVIALDCEWCWCSHCIL